jgi:glycosyltransferase involved in cell wall biosynthesis
MERQLTELIRGLLGRGQAVTVIARRCDLPRHRAMRWIRVPGPNKPFPLAYPWFFILGTWQVWRHRAGLLHTTGAIVWNRADISTIHHCHLASHGNANRAWHGLGPLRRMNRQLSGILARLAERALYRPARTRHFVTVSMGVEREVREYFPKLSRQITMIPNAVDQQLFRADRIVRRDVRAMYGLSASNFVALFVGGDWELKGLAVAIEAAASVPTCHLVVVGAGDVDRFQSLARRFQAENRVYFAGPRTDASRYYSAADVFLLPTLYETFSLVTYEAAACELPLLVTKVSGVEDILRHGENGWFIQRDPRTISSRLQELQANEALRQRMGARSRELVAAFSWPRVVGDYIELYERLAGVRRSAGELPDLVAEYGRK